MEEIGVIHHQRAARALGERDELFTLRNAGTHRLFDQHMPEARKRTPRQFEMVADRRRDRDRFILRIVDEIDSLLVQTQIGSKGCSIGAIRLAPLGDRHRAKARVRGEVPQQVRPPVAKSTNADLDHRAEPDAVSDTPISASFEHLPRQCPEGHQKRGPKTPKAGWSWNALRMATRLLSAKSSRRQRELWNAAKCALWEICVRP
jgi:hypothetical protein